MKEYNMMSQLALIIYLSPKKTDEITFDLKLDVVVMEICSGLKYIV